MDFDSIQVEN